jgi:hypothetical protein
VRLVSALSKARVRDEHTYPVVVHGSGDPTHVWALRDTGATVCLLKEGGVPLGYLTPLNETIELQGFYGDARYAPLYRMHIASAIARGSIVVAMSQAGCNWPAGVSLIVENDYGVKFGPVCASTTASVVATDTVTSGGGGCEVASSSAVNAVTRRQAQLGCC